MDEFNDRIHRPTSGSDVQLTLHSGEFSIDDKQGVTTIKRHRKSTVLRRSFKRASSECAYSPEEKVRLSSILLNAVKYLEEP